MTFSRMFSILIFSIVWLAIGRLEVTFSNGFRAVESESAISCLTDREISNAVRTLASAKTSRVASARALLLNSSKQSTECRSKIVEALMKAMDQPNLDFKRDTESYYLWRNGADLFGDLQATEALDLLISHMNLSTAFFNSSMNHRPAMRGIIKMGSLALPKLTEVLLHNPDPQMRSSAIYCVATIGGQPAVAVLKQALVSESDVCVKRLIKTSLDSFDDEGQIKNRMEWFAAFNCKS